MAAIRPFRAITFRLDAETDVSPHAAPPYDVISPERRDALLAREAHNVVALELPQDPSGGDPYEAAARTWDEWRGSGILADDAADAVYILEQEFEVGGARVTRRAFVAAVDLEPFSARVILPHERTLSKALADRLALMRATRANLSQVLGLFSDAAGETDALLDTSALGMPMLQARDDDVVSRVWAMREPHRVRALTEALEDKSVFIADGHHRYTTALAYRDECRAEPGGTTWRPCDSVMMALANMDDPDLVVLPTHRVADAAGEFDPAAFWRALERRFELRPVPPGDPAGPLADATGRSAYVVKVAGEEPRLACLRADVDLDEAIAADASRAWKELDVAVLQELVLDPLLGIHPDRPETLGRLGFCKDPSEALAQADEHDVVFLMRPTRMDQLRAVALSGEMMPQKSTYFYPKLLSGLLMRTLDER